MIDGAGHAVLILQVGGEAEGADRGGGPVRVSSVLHDSKGVIWCREASDQPDNLRWRPAADGRARHRLIVGAVYRLCRQLDLDIRPSCKRKSQHVKIQVSSGLI